jgi:hypothetical protein
LAKLDSESAYLREQLGPKLAEHLELLMFELNEVRAASALPPLV